MYVVRCFLFSLTSTRHSTESRNHARQWIGVLGNTNEAPGSFLPAGKEKNSLVTYIIKRGSTKVNWSTIHRYELRLQQAVCWRLPLPHRYPKSHTRSCLLNDSTLARTGRVGLWVVPIYPCCATSPITLVTPRNTPTHVKKERHGPRGWFTLGASTSSRTK